MKSKKIIGILMSSFLVMSLAAGCGSSNNGGTNKEAEKKPEVVLRLADNHSGDYPTIIGDKKFAELVEEKTDGRIKVEVYDGGQLGDEKTVIEQVQFGAIDVTRTSISPLTEFDKKLSVLMLPYLYRDKEHMFTVLDGEIGDEFLKGLEEHNYVGLCWFDSGARSFYNSKKEVKSVEDLEGLKIRVQKSQIMMDLVQALGASPTPMAFSEVYSAIQTKVIDGAENNWPSYLSTSHYEVAKYFTVDEHTRVPELILMSKLTFDKLSAEDQKIIKEAAQEAAIVEREAWEAKAKSAEEEIVAAGNIITRLEAPTKQTFQDTVKPLYEKYGAGYEEIIQKIIDTK